MGRMHEVLALCLVLCVAVVLADPPIPAPKFTIDLDADPVTRWQPIVAQFRNDYGPILAYLDQYYPPWMQPIFDPIVAQWDQYIPQPYADELRGVAAAFNGSSGMDLGKVVLLNLIYDFSAFCTSIVAQNAQGSIYHVRNLDYPFPGLQNVTIEVDFQRNGQTVYRGVTFAGYIGLLTGVRPSGWSVTVNQRDIPGDSVLDWFKNIEEWMAGATPLALRLRETLEMNSTFSDAISTLQHVHLMSTVYLTLAGTQPGEGAIVTRDRDDPADVWWIASPEAWYRGQTNDDHWLPPLDDRRDAMNAMMSMLNSSSITLPSLYSVLSTPPVFNHATRYTALMHPATGEIQTMIRYDAPSVESETAAGYKIVIGHAFFEELDQLVPLLGDQQAPASEPSSDDQDDQDFYDP